MVFPPPRNVCQLFTVVQLAASTITTHLPCFISCQAAVQQSLSQELCDLVRAH
jgi:hypothetical protein